MNAPADRLATGHGVLRRAVVGFVLSSVLALVLLSITAILVSRHLAQDSALREARTTGATVAQAIAGPLVDLSVRGGDPDALARLDRVLTDRMEAADIAHVKLWTRDGTVLWADQEGIVGRTYELEDSLLGLFGTDGVIAEVSELEKEENVNERDAGELLEVYAGTTDANGQPLVVEAYFSTEQMRDREWDILGQLLPLTLGALLLFQILVLPLAVSLARRVERGERDRGRMMRHALLSSTRERRRIAQDLHDGVIQDLAGLRYAMPMVAARLPDTPEAADARRAVAHADTILKRDVDSLRSMLIDIYPPSLAEGGLAVAASDLAQQAQAAGIEVDIDVPERAAWSMDASRLAYRVLQEGIRNLVKHSGASSARVAVRRDHHDLEVLVADDGRGLDPSSTPAEGHMGLQLLRDSLEDLGARLSIGPGAGGGTVLAARIPADLLAE